MKYELICACGDHIKLVELLKVQKVYVGYCLGCDEFFTLSLELNKDLKKITIRGGSYTHRQLMTIINKKIKGVNCDKRI